MAELKARMGLDEFNDWQLYFQVRDTMAERAFQESEERKAQGMATCLDARFHALNQSRGMTHGK